MLFQKIYYKFLYKLQYESSIHQESSILQKKFNKKWPQVANMIIISEHKELVALYTCRFIQLIMRRLRAIIAFQEAPAAITIDTSSDESSDDETSPASPNLSPASPDQKP